MAWQGGAVKPQQPLRVDVPLGSRSYPIHIHAGLVSQAGALMRPHLTSARVLIVADATVFAHHGASLRAALAGSAISSEVVLFPSGEPSKTLETAELAWKACAQHRIDRRDAIVALGGGVSGDLAGFVAACWMRGITLVQIPTTLLAMVDSSVGGKTGVNSSAGKNLIGAFKQPACVIIDPALTATMDGREYRAGLAEVLKYGVIHDPGFFAWQEAHAEGLASGDPDLVAHAVAESCRIKAWYVGQDETEQGVRAELNYGHTFGHAVERDTDYRTFLHGEAVGIGMRMAVDLSQRLGILRDERLGARQDALLARYQLPLVHRSADPVATATRLTGHCRLDKKVAAGHMRFILPTAMGAVVHQVVDDAGLVQAAFSSGLTTLNAP
jgi:3-dehydroquinate synthase